MQIKTIIQSHTVAITLAIIVGGVSIAPQLYLLKDQNYKDIQMFGTDAEYDYVAKMNQASYDDYSKGPFPPDPGRNYYLAPKLGERTMGFLATVSHTRAIEINVIFKFVCSALLFLILYGWLLEMFSLKAVALIVPLFVILGVNLLSPVEIWKLASLKTSIDTFLPYTRPISPQISSIFLFLGLWGIYNWGLKESRLKTAIFLGVLSGLSLYEYIYTWTFLTVVLSLYLVYFVLYKKTEKAKYFSCTLAINGIIAFPFFINLLKARLDPDYIDTAARIGTISSHTPIFGVWILLGYLALIFLWPRDKYRDIKYFFLFLFTALVVVLNQQIITGLKLQPGHYHWYTTKPLIAIIIIFLGIYCIKRAVTNKKLRIAIPVFLGAIFFLNAIVIQTHSYATNYPTYEKNQRYAPLLSFLNGTYQQEKTIWADPDLSTLIMAYTQHNAPDNRHAQYYLDSRNHLRDMLFLEYRLKGVTEKNITSVMESERDYVTSKIFGIYYRDLPGDRKIPEAELNKLVLEYKEFYKIPLDQVFKNVKIDLIVEDKVNNDLSIDKLAFLSRISIGDGLYVYQFKVNQ